jgi:hypothetical protein
VLLLLVILHGVTACRTAIWATYSRYKLLHALSELEFLPDVYAAVPSLHVKTAIGYFG